MNFLFENFEIFLIVYAAVVLDTVLGVTHARITGVFSWKFLPEFLNTMIRYTVYLLFGNVVNHFSKLTGYQIEGAGLYAVAFVLLAVEAASMKQSIKESLPNRK